MNNCFFPLWPENPLLLAPSLMVALLSINFEVYYVMDQFSVGTPWKHYLVIWVQSVDSW